MKTGNRFLFQAAILAISCAPVFADTGLTNIGDLSIRVLVRSVPADHHLDVSKLRTAVTRELKESDIRLSQQFLSEGKAEPPCLNIYVDMLRLGDTQRYAFHIRSVLTANIYLARGARIEVRKGERNWTLTAPTANVSRIKADLWKSNEDHQIQTVPAKDMPQEVTEAVLRQVEAFSTAYRSANPATAQATHEEKSVAVLPTAEQQPLGQATEPQTPVQYKYVASKNSKVFHRADCSSAKRISPENLVGYKTRDEAIKAGKRPCKICKP